MATSDVYRSPNGTKDVFGQESRKWQVAISKFAQQAHLYNYDLIVNPTFEYMEVFQRVGQDTDIVSKEMYDFKDKGDRHIALRPEGTAQVARTFSQHRPQTPFKVWSLLSGFRYERPQKGRLREFHQLSIEALGIDNPSIDVETIEFANQYLRSMDLSDFHLEINSLGDVQARNAHMEKLREYFSKYESELGDSFVQRVHKNPLRVLDSKVPQWQEVISGAPSIHDYLSNDSIEQFGYLKSELSRRNIAFDVVPSMVRGLDYYNNTIFEFVSNSIDAAQSTICAGGRYNKLVALMDGPETSGVGFALGVERLLLACDAENVDLDLRKLDVYFIDLVRDDNSSEISYNLVSDLRKSGISVDVQHEHKSMKASLKNADKSDAKFAIFLASSELEKGLVVVKDMVSGEQNECRFADVANFINNA